MTDATDREGGIRPPSFEEGFSPEEIQLLCPVCAFNYVHLEAVTVQQETQFVVVEPSGVHVTEGPRSPRRGSEVTLMLHCEAGHRFGLGIYFHKGQLCFYTQQTGTWEDGSPPAELWRD